MLYQHEPLGRRNVSRLSCAKELELVLVDANGFFTRRRSQRLELETDRSQAEVLFILYDGVLWSGHRAAS